MAGFSIEVTGLEAVLARLGRKERVLSDLELDLRKGGETFGQIEAAAFASGDHWAADTEGTAEYKAQEGWGGRTLVRSGDLEADMSTPKVLEYGPTELTAGTDLPYAHFQQEGFRQVWGFRRTASDRLVLEKRQNPGRTQARPPINLSGEEHTQIADAVAVSTVARLEEAN